MQLKKAAISATQDVNAALRLAPGQAGHLQQVGIHVQLIETKGRVYYAAPSARASPAANAITLAASSPGLVNQVPREYGSAVLVFDAADAADPVRLPDGSAKNVGSGAEVLDEQHAMRVLRAACSWQRAALKL